jgi:hypothetical protein
LPKKIISDNGLIINNITQLETPKLEEKQALQENNVVTYLPDNNDITIQNVEINSLRNKDRSLTNYVKQQLQITAQSEIISVNKPINSTEKIKTYGFGLGLDYKLPRNFFVSVNFASDNLRDVPSNFIASFNSPQYKANASVGNSGFGPKRRMGFNIAYRWQDEFYFEGDLANGTLPAVQTLDAQFSYKLPKTKSIVIFGAYNLLNQYYYNGVGNAFVGGLYYVSFAYNVY